MSTKLTQPNSQKEARIETSQASPKTDNAPQRKVL